MNILYLDIRFSFMSFGTSGKFNGGNNYTKKIIDLLMNNVKPDWELVLVVNEVIYQNLNEKLCSAFKFLIVNSLRDVKVKDCQEVLFIPHVNDSKGYLRELKDFKMSHNSCKIYLTIHDRRHSDVFFDKYAGVFKKGIKRFPVIFFIGKYIKSKSTDSVIKRFIALADKVFTVSNFSLQALSDIKSLKNINFYLPVYQPNKSNKVSIIAENDIKKQKYILFVSAGRSEKNFIRALLAFQQYVNQHNDETIKMVITGISQNQINNLVNKKIVRDSFIKKSLIIFDYVEQEQLIDLYRNCYCLLFTSFSEGFGLPVAEAILFGKPIVASWRTAIPEVAGSVGIYVNPFSISSIKDGIEKVMNKSKYKFIIDLLHIKKEILQNQIKLDDDLLLNDIFEV